MRNFILIVLISTLTSITYTYGQYQFEAVYDLECTPIKNQQRTGTCWSFATCSFMESELIRMGKAEYDLSEMYVVQQIYKEKARNYILRQGKSNFSQGSLAHDFLNAVSRYGIVPESVYDGKDDIRDAHNHSEMEAALKGMLDGILKQKRVSDKWDDAFDAVLQIYLGSYAEKFVVDGMAFTPQTFAQSLGLNTANYLHFTSFTHHPFYSKFILEIPDNFSNGSFINLPLDEMQAIVDEALENGFTVAWDGDVSEVGFSRQHNIAILSDNRTEEEMFATPGPEVAVNQTNRQASFESYATTDDHLMHIVGMYKDQDGTKYYKVKNSWGTYGAYDGYVYISEAYLKMKTISITVHKDAVPKSIMEKVSL